MSLRVFKGLLGAGGRGGGGGGSKNGGSQLLSNCVGNHAFALSSFLPV